MSARALVAGALIALVPPAAGASDAFLRGTGLAFPQALPDHGQALELVGELGIGGSHPPFAPDPLAEHTWTVTGPVVHSVDEPAPGLRTLELTFGVLEIRADRAGNAVFAPDPPNAWVPSTFHDGEALLVGRLTDLTIREIFGIVTASGDLTFVAGSELGSLGSTPEWTFRAAVSTYGETLPAGYGAHWSIELSPAEPVPVRPASWGGIKALYR